MSARDSSESHSLRMALVAYVVTVLANGLTILFFVANGAFHHLVGFEIFKRCAEIKHSFFMP